MWFGSILDNLFMRTSGTSRLKDARYFFIVLDTICLLDMKLISVLTVESDSESDDGDNVYYSVWDSKPPLPPTGAEDSGQSNLTISVSVAQGTFSFLTDVKVKITCFIPTSTYFYSLFCIYLLIYFILP